MSEGMRSIAELIRVQKERMLDLSAKNQLLHLNLTTSRPSATNLVVADERPNQLVQRLSRPSGMSFLPREKHEDPDSLEDRLAMASAEGTASRHEDAKIQTLLEDMASLQRNLQKMAKRSDDLYNEKGVKTLSLIFGFLEYPRLNTPDTNNTSPLFMFPVDLVRTSDGGSFQFKLHARGVQPTQNETLAQLLQRDYGLVLPALEIDEDGFAVDPESYLQKVQRWIEQEDLVARGFRCVMKSRLAFLNASNMALIADLADEGWEECEATPPSMNPLVAMAFTGQVVPGLEYAPGKPEVYQLDTHSVGQKLHAPLAADSSQMSAMVDVLEGKSLVLEGPPGTGKSQTISNVIALAMAQGKSVLFVTEKLAAQSVVEDRLGGLGLSDYVLQVHSTQSKITAIVQQLKDRLDASKPRSPAELPRQTKKFDKARDQLGKYLKYLHETPTPLGCSLYECIGQAEVVRSRGEETAKFPAGALPSSQEVFDKVIGLLQEYQHLRTDIQPDEAESLKKLPVSKYGGVSPDLIREQILTVLRFVDAGEADRLQRSDETAWSSMQVSEESSAKGFFGRLIDALTRGRRSSRAKTALARSLGYTAGLPNGIESPPLLVGLYEHAPRFSVWKRLLEVVGALKQHGMPGSIEKMPNPAEVYAASVPGLLAEHLLKSNPSMHKMSARALEQCQEELQSSDDALRPLISRSVANKVHAMETMAPGGEQGTKVAELTEMNLIRHECGKSRRYVPLRQLFARAPKAIVALKPCILMDPETVAEVLPKQSDLFDLVIFDEASQIQPGRALGALSRGRQFLIVGDPKQLPPTSFFSASNEVDEGEDSLLGSDAESILEVAQRSMPPAAYRRLQWHYRSEHESLIAFSNRMFYEGDLVVFPSPDAASDGRGVTLEVVPDGFFAGGMNQPEAQAVAFALARFVAEQANEEDPHSIGVATMNRAQADLIDDCWNTMLSEDATLMNAFVEYQKNVSEPIFIKNLENVQGDERDHILISYTYGPERPGLDKIHQRFGPINMDGGWRRLNVLVTRAKKSVRVYASMRSGQVLAENEAQRGKVAFQKYLAYAESGANMDLVVPTATAEAENDFERSIISSIESLGFECDAQVGVSGYFIDIGVRRPGEQTYILAVECDGATYHSSKSARDRDINRQQILEHKGWRFHRVWSTDWFRNRKDAEEKLAQALRAAAE